MAAASSASGRNPWDVDGVLGGPPDVRDLEDGENSDSDLELSEEDQAAHDFVEVLTDLYFSSTISAKTLCVLCHYAQTAGIKHERLHAYAFAPTTRTGKDTESGNFQKHLNVFMGLYEAKRNLHNLRVPGSSRLDLGRGIVDMPVRAPHEVVEQEVQADPQLVYKTQELVMGDQLPPSYHNHPVVVGSPEPPIPYALYSDAVPYSKVDSAIGFWLCNIVTGSRHIVAIMRKAQLCKCGCKGWCSFWPVLEFLRWSLAAMGKGEHP